MEPQKIKPMPPEQIPVDPPKQRLRPNPFPTTMKDLAKKLLLKLKEGTTWMGFAVLAQFLPLNVEELQAVWTVITGIAGVILMFWDEDKTKAVKAEQPSQG